jgi:uncharacterized RDD family membrane protein YckC
MPDRTMAPAGLWVRILAFVVNYLPIAAYLAALVAAGAWLGRSSQPLARVLFGGPVAGEATGFWLITLPVTLYFGLSEASCRQATWGKRRTGLMVTDLVGMRLSLLRSIGRTVLKFIPWELAHACIWQISFAREKSSAIYVAGFATVWLIIGANVVSLLVSPTRQTLYDRLAGTLVVHGHPSLLTDNRMNLTTSR